MRGILKFSTHNGHTRTLITLYVLHSLHCEPKTGYDLLREIDDMTGGEWVPSKGTLYPMLRHLADEGLIAPQETGARSKTIYALTEEGETTLAEIKKSRHQSRENFQLLRNIHSEIFGEEFASLAEKIWEIRESVRDLPDEKQDAASEILDTCIIALRKLEEDR
ncbi:PadR family transcriptional regulator [Methanogenium sp. MK-MG]|uniref:PadR family transcriptional regulator n=1 Tax=Methanogenium sp. MK-MG TaxID=2599926 RepID=UPI0013EBFAA0|nr:PadR family transcriptional regulator [Methanogenium sp. MK-MG]KAF1077521.1 hypothetical protein MKMG_01267 [Methanogenium sp. MK-MG]